MFWTPKLARCLEEAPWPLTRNELIDFVDRTACPMQVVENIYQLPDNDELIEGIEDLWPEYADSYFDEYFYNENDEDELTVFKRQFDSLNNNRKLHIME